VQKLMPFDRATPIQRSGTNFSEISDILMGLVCSLEDSKYRRSEVYRYKILIVSL
jgi:hypothetical protein